MDGYFVDGQFVDGIIIIDNYGQIEVHNSI